jgi:hypothetical protein
MGWVAGIDPGFRKGGVALIAPDGTYGVHKLPIVPDKGIDVRALFTLLDKPDVSIWIEKVGPMPRQGSVSTFRFGFGLGQIMACISTLGVEPNQVLPRTWKEHWGLGKDKDECRVLAQKKFPDIAGALKRKNSHDLAEALLIAGFGKFKQGQGL